MKTKLNKFRQAALAYLIYGIVYEGFTIYSIFTRGLPPGVPTSMAVTFLLIGALIMALFPYLIFREYGLFTKIVSILVGLRAIALIIIIADLPLPSFYEREFFFLKRMSSTEVYIFALGVTLLTLYFVARAGWDIDFKTRMRKSIQNEK
jgi:hypothetical protein